MIKLVLEKFPELHLDHAFDLAILYRKVSVANLLIDTAIKQQKRLFIRRKDESQQVEMPKILNSALTQRTCAEVEFIKACYSGNTERVKQLLRDGISADLEDEDGLTPLLIAVRNGNNDLVKVLLASGGLTSTLAPPSYDIAELAVIRGHIDVLRTLLERNVPYDRATTFVTAITCRSVDAVKLLDPPITEKLREGRTLLHIAAKKNFKEAVEVLLQAGAPQSTDDSGRTPMSYTENQEVLHLFRQWKASP
jgi:ankyrin repeat protein